jgi:hypothetical protein
MPRLSELYGQRLAARRIQIEANVRAMGEILDRTQKEVLGTPGPPSSRPGTPPHRRSGQLQRAAAVKVNPTKGTIQLLNTAPHAPYLRDGTARMAPRPYQSLVMTLARPQLDEIERRGMPFGGK